MRDVSFKTYVLTVFFYLHQSNRSGGGMYWGRSFRCLVVVRFPFTPISCDTVSRYSVERFPCNLAQIFIMWVGIAEGSEVKGKHFHRVSSTLTFCISIWCFLFALHLCLSVTCPLAFVADKTNALHVTQQLLAKLSVLDHYWPFLLRKRRNGHILLPF